MQKIYYFCNYCNKDITQEDRFTVKVKRSSYDEEIKKDCCLDCFDKRIKFYDDPVLSGVLENLK